MMLPPQQLYQSTNHLTEPHLTDISPLESCPVLCSHSSLFLFGEQGTVLPLQQLLKQIVEVIWLLSIPPHATVELGLWEKEVRTAGAKAKSTLTVSSGCMCIVP